MNEQERQQKADDAYEERWMARYGFVPPCDPEHPITKEFWQREMAWHESRIAAAQDRLRITTAELIAAFADRE